MANVGSTICYTGLDIGQIRHAVDEAKQLLKEITSMATFDPTKPSTFELFGLTNNQLRRRGFTAEQIQELRRVQRDAPPARTVDEVEAALASQTPPEEPAAPRRHRTEGSGSE